MVLEAAENACLDARQKRLHVIPLGVVREIHVEVPVPRISGIAAMTAPNLMRAGRITSECRKPAWREEWREDAPARRRIGMHHAVGLEQEPPQPRIGQGGLDLRR